MSKTYSRKGELAISRRKSKATLKIQKDFSSGLFMEAPSARISVRPKLLHDQNLILSSFDRHFIFNNLDKQQRKEVLQSMKYFELDKNEDVFKEGDSGHFFFVVSLGRLEVSVEDLVTGELSLGDSFGQLALMHHLKRSSSVCTLTSVALWGLQRAAFKEVVQHVNHQNYTENKKFLESISIFKNLRSSEKDALLNNLTVLKFNAKQRIVVQGDIGDFLYIIKEGSVVCSKEGQELRRMEKGEFFGEQALLFKSPRTATIVAERFTKCLVISKKQLTQTFGQGLRQIIYRNSKLMAIEQSELLSKLSADQKARLLSSMEIVTYRKGEIVIPEGSKKGKMLWILMYGHLQDSERAVQVLDCIGDKELLHDPMGIYEETLIATEDSDIAEITRDSLETAIGGPLRTATTNNEAVKALKRAQLFKTVSDEKLRRLVECMKLETFCEMQAIVKQNDPGSRFYIIKSGVVDVVMDGVSKRHLMKLDYFGERSILFEEPRTATVVALDKVLCWVLYQEDFLGLLDENIREKLIKRIVLQDITVKLEDFLYVQPLAKNSTSNSSLVQHRKDHHLYLLKTIDRAQIYFHALENRLILQRKLLLELDHDMIVKLVKTFQDNHRIYFLMEYVPGIDFSVMLQQSDILQERDARFYLACIVTVIEHLHERGIVHRELRPEKFMIDELGYLKIVNLGECKELCGRTFTVLGSPHYMSPEAIEGNGYSFPADFWSIGVILYEFLCGFLPFGDNVENPYEIYQFIIEGKFEFPEFIKLSEDVKDLIGQLLSRDTVRRNSVEVVIGHKWFCDFRWEDLKAKLMGSPFVPQIDRHRVVNLQKLQGMREAVMTEVFSHETTSGMSRNAQDAPEDWDSGF